MEITHRSRSKRAIGDITCGREKTPTKCFFILCYERCHYDLRLQPADLSEWRQVIDLPDKRLWVTEHRVEEKQCPRCYHLTRAALSNLLYF